MLALLVLFSLWSVRLASRPREIDPGRSLAADPENPDLCMELAQRAEFARDLPLAERSLLRAAAISRLYQPRYLLAQYYFRHPSSDLFWTWSRAALETAYGDNGALLDLIWRAYPDGQWLWEHAIPHRPIVVRQYLGLLNARAQWRPAFEVAQYLARNGDRPDVQALLIWCDTRLAAGDFREPRSVWNELCRRKVLAYDPGALVTNPGFIEPAISAGFDWRPAATPGVTIALGGGRLRLDLTGQQPEQCTLVWQYLALEAGARYAADQEGLERGFAWELEGSRLLLTYRRPQGSSRFAGTVVLNGVRVERLP